MTDSELQQLLASVKAGSVDPDDAWTRIAGAMRDAPFDDLGFARVDLRSPEAVAIRPGRDAGSV